MRIGMLLVLLVIGCSTQNSKTDPPPDAPPVAAAATKPAHIDNPSFIITMDQANQAIKEMSDHPMPFARPVVIVGGFADPDLGPSYIAGSLTKFGVHPILIPVGLATCNSFEDCRRVILEAVDKTCPNPDPIWTAPVDVIGLSLGGVAARYAAVPSADPQHPRRLNIAHLYCVSSPHLGAILADKIAINPLSRDMKTGSAFLVNLAKTDSDAHYNMICYVLLGDEIVGDRNASPQGQNPYWLADDAPISFGAHTDATRDPRILADIARRLRGGSPFTRPPPSPIPDGAN